MAMVVTTATGTSTLAWLHLAEARTKSYKRGHLEDKIINLRQGI